MFYIVLMFASFMQLFFSFELLIGFGRCDGDIRRFGIDRLKFDLMGFLLLVEDETATKVIRFSQWKKATRHKFFNLNNWYKATQKIISVETWNKLREWSFS